MPLPLLVSMLGAALAMAAVCPPAVASPVEPALLKSVRREQVAQERQFIADQGDGTFRNPVLAGHYHDPTVVRVGDDFYLTHCEHDFRGPIIWHSRDLVNWRPLGRVESLSGLGEMWAMDLIHHDGLFYLYVPVRLRTADGSLNFSNYVVTAKDPAGPWSEPVDLRFGGIDPGHVVDRDGRRFIYVNAGRVIALTPDGLGAAGELVTVYDGWDIPEDWTIECHCLESPKLFWRGDWCYMVSAQGGTVGPSTSHMVVVARSKSALGPWENAPDSPLLRTWHRDELWWSQGHGTLIEATDGSWWMMYHAIPRERRSLGRNTLLVPIKWSADGWPYVPLEADPSIAMRKPPGENVGHGLPLSDRFDGPQLGLQWDPLGIPEPDAPPARVEQGQLILPARGDGPENAARLGVLPVNGSYEITVEVHAPPGTDAGLGLFSGSAFTGISLRDGIVRHPRRGQNQANQRYADGHVFLKVRNVDHDVTFFHSADGLTWHKYHWGANLSTEIAARAGFYAAGDGEVRFDNFTYRGL